MNKAAKLVSNQYILYSHDDMYFCPEWDKVLLNEVNTFNDDLSQDLTLLDTNVQKTGDLITLRYDETSWLE